MSEEGGDGGNFVWPKQSLAFSNPDNSGATDEKPDKKQPDSTSKTPIASVAAPPSTVAKKRSRNGVPKNGRSSRDSKQCKDEGVGDPDHHHHDDHEIHIWTERERRKKMRNMFSNLHALLPNLPAKADKSTIVDEAVSYIKTLENNLQKLQKRKLEMLRGPPIIDFNTSSSSSSALALESRESFLADQLGCSSSSKNQAITATSNSPFSSTFGVPQFPICFQTWSSPNVVLSVCGTDAQICVCAPKKPGLLTAIFYVLEKFKLEVVTANISSDNYQSMYMIHAHYANGGADQFSETLPVEEIYKIAVGEMMFWLSS
ncbi:transcription factor bHLH95 [Telopea speciosissima]|uniref:transcription factor bHLH95 n=1 Tax=Telopea speciosissima TaxID=54955 RepID=UPI001CC47319|nr:transcription factor bHLH95 [Telopea speciosissima]